MTVRVLVTRAAADAAELVDGLVALGVDVVQVPLIERRYAPLDPALLRARYDVLLLTSPAAARGLVGLEPRWERVAAVGPATCEAAREIGLEPEVVPEHARGAEAVRALGDLHGAHVLLPGAERLTASTVEALGAAGAEVDHRVVYRNQVPDGARAALLAALPVTLATVLSASAARRLAELGAGAQLPPCVCLGPSTAAQAGRCGLVVRAVASPHTVPGLLRAMSRLVNASG